MLTTTPRKRQKVKTIFDYLSELPDGILHSILDVLPLDNAARTAALSRRWRHVWCTNPSLSFAFLSHHSVNPSTYKQIVDSALSLCSSIEHISSISFALNRRDPDLDAITRRWVSFAASRSVQSLSLNYYGPNYFLLQHSENEDPFDMPPRVLACADIFSCQTLRSLKLQTCNIPPLPDNHDKPHFPFLESLKLQGVILDKKILLQLISSSPQLKYLFLDQVSSAYHHLEISTLEIPFPGVSSADHQLEISSPTLEILDVHHINFSSVLDSDDVVASLFKLPIKVHSVPKLRSLGLCTELSHAIFFNLVGADKLEEVTLLWSRKDAPSDINQWRHMISFAKKAITLVIDCWFLQTYDVRSLSCHGPFFSNLRRLQICGITPQWLPHLIATLGNCPILEHLRFIECYRFSGESAMGQYDNNRGFTTERKNEKAKELVEEIESNSLAMPPLKVLEIVGKSFEAEGVWMELIEFILGKAATLESLSVYYRTYFKADVDESFERIKSFYRASPIVKLAFSQDTEGSTFGQARVCAQSWNDIFLV